jgi:hypothetical protein
METSFPILAVPADPARQWVLRRRRMPSLSRRDGKPNWCGALPVGCRRRNTDFPTCRESPCSFQCCSSLFRPATGCKCHDPRQKRRSERVQLCSELRGRALVGEDPVESTCAAVWRQAAFGGLAIRCNAATMLAASGAPFVSLRRWHRVGRCQHAAAQPGRVVASNGSWACSERVLTYTCEHRSAGRPWHGV